MIASVALMLAARCSAGKVGRKRSTETLVKSFCALRFAQLRLVSRCGHPGQPIKTISDIPVVPEILLQSQALGETHSRLPGVPLPL
jgi:hypothetical protein